MSSKTEFSKWQDLGNDYVIIASSSLGFDLTAAGARAICDRHLGIGADGILAWGSSAGADFRLDIYNPDGSRAEMCGNGVRMLARYLYDNGHADSPVIDLETDAGIIRTTIKDDGQVEVRMGRARLEGDGIRGSEETGAAGEVLNRKLEVNGREFEFTFVDMGNPHCVIETEDLENLDLEVLGPAIENHKLFPNRTNVEFMKIMGPVEVGMRVWERGAGETSACGTGACAVAVAACRTKGTESPVTVHLPGGDLRVEVGPGMEVTMTGPAAEVFTGSLSETFINHIKEL